MATPSPTAPFLGHFCDPMPIRSRGAFQVLSARGVESGIPCVVLLPGPTGEAPRIADAFAEIDRIHALIDHPVVPKVLARGEFAGKPFLAFDCDATVDGMEVLRLIADSDQKIPFGAADAFIASLRMAMTTAHGVTDPLTGGPICLGRISAGNTLFSASGRWFLLGFGRNWPIEKHDGTIDGNSVFFQAPELWTGAPATPTEDYVALVLFMRSLLPYVEMTGAVARILRGDFRPADMEIIDCLRWVEQRMLGEIPSLRATIPEAVAVADRIRELCEVTLDPDGFAAYVAGLVRESDEPARMEGDEPATSLTLTIGAEARWIAAPDGARYPLGRSLRLIILAMAGHHRRADDTPLRTHDLLEVGWPGEAPEHEAGIARVYVAVNRLRNMGLRDVIERFDDGYRLSPRAEIILRDP